MFELITKILLWFVFIINLLLLLMFIAGKLYVFELKKWIKFVALYSVFITGLLLLNICVISISVILSLFVGNFLQAIILPIFAILPFIIGKFATYDKINFYTNIQIIQFVFTLITTYILIAF